MSSIHNQICLCEHSSRCIGISRTPQKSVETPAPTPGYEDNDGNEGNGADAAVAAESGSSEGTVPPASVRSAEAANVFSRTVIATACRTRPQEYFETANEQAACFGDLASGGRFKRRQHTCLRNFCFELALVHVACRTEVGGRAVPRPSPRSRQRE